MRTINELLTLISNSIENTNNTVYLFSRYNNSTENPAIHYFTLAADNFVMLSVQEWQELQPYFSIDVRHELITRATTSAHSILEAYNHE